MSNYPGITLQMVVDTVLLFALLGPLLALHYLSSPGKAGFWCHDQSLSLPYKPDSITKQLLLTLGFGGNLMTICVTETVRAVSASSRKTPCQLKSALMSILKSSGVFIFGMMVDCLFTEMLKYSVSRPRPHFFEVCKPNFEQTNCSSVVWPKVKYVEEYECSNTQVDTKLLNDSRLSFPSGHASVSMYCALFIVFYLQLRMNPGFSHLLRPLLQMAPVFLATYCCVTRIIDHKHFVSDILAGVTIGSTIAYLTFYKLGAHLIPESAPPSRKPGVLPRAMSVESEPQTPTPLLRPAAYIQVRRSDYVDKV